MGYLRARFPALAVTSVLGCAALGGGLIGCGDDDEDDESTTSGGAAPAATDQQAISQDLSAKSGAGIVQTALETYYTENGSYSGATTSTLAQVTPSVSDYDPKISTGPQTYEITVDSESGNAFTVAKDESGTVTKTCESPGAGDCPDNGEW